jgi:hypothetical protein
MATDQTVTYATRGAAYATLFDARVASNINRSAVLFQLLKKLPCRGKNVTWDAKTGTAAPTTAPQAEGADVVDFLADDKQPASLAMAHYHDAFAVTGFMQAVARNTGNPEELTDAILSELKDSTDRLGASMGTHVYTGSGAANQVLGFFDATAGGLLNSGTYAGIDRSTYTQFKGINVDAKNQRISTGLVRELSRGIYTASGKNVEFYITTPICFDFLAESLKAQRRFVQDVSLSRGLIKLDGGFTAVDFDGVPVFRDVRCPAGYFGAFNSEEHLIRYMPQPTVEDYKRAEVTATPEAQLKATGTGAMGKIVELAKSGDKTKIGIFIDWQVQARTPNAGGFILNCLES